MAVIDPSTELGKRLRERLNRERIIWLTTVNKDGEPQSSPVWFHADGDQVLIFSQPNAPKVRNISRNPVVSLNLNSSDDGGNVAVLTGTAKILEDGPRVHEVDAYVTKYDEGFRQLGSTPEEMGAEYSAAIRVHVSRVRGW